MNKILFVFLLLFPLLNFAQTKHVVQRGETLDLIANRYGIASKLIRDANPLVDECYTGITLTIPQKPKPVVSSTPTRTKSRVPNERKVKKTTYAVRPNTRSNVAWGGYANYYQSTYNPYWNNNQMIWQTQHNQLQAAVCYLFHFQKKARYRGALQSLCTRINQDLHHQIFLNGIYPHGKMVRLKV